MTTLTLHSPARPASTPVLRQVELTRPFTWLRRGSRDLIKSWPASLGLGLLFTLAGLFLLDWAWDRPHLAMALTGGFLLVAPFLAIGFYAISRRNEHRHRLGWLLSYSGLRRNAFSIGLYAFLLAFILSAWERLSAILVGLFLSGGVTLNSYFDLRLLFTTEHLAFVLVYLLLGAVLAAGVFVLSVVTLPLLMDRRIDVVTAMLTSLRVVRANPQAMGVWAGLITVLAGLGLASGLYAFVLIFPLLGHATWHAYRDLVRRHG